MQLIASVPFMFRGYEYYALVRTRNRDDYTELRVTIMDGQLERSDYENHLFLCKKGFLFVEYPADREKIADLKPALVHALNAYLYQLRKEAAFVESISLAGQL